jgi:hypothetical protein
MLSIPVIYIIFSKMCIIEIRLAVRSVHALAHYITIL